MFFLLTNGGKANIINDVDAGLAHLVERLLPKQKVASSSLVTRSKIKRTPSGVLFILEYGNAYPLRRESNSPDFTRKGNPQRFPFHTFPSLRGGGLQEWAGRPFYFGVWERIPLAGGKQQP